MIILRSKTTTEKCGTCEFWNGNRNPVFDGKGNPKIDIIDDSGICENANSRFVDTIKKQTGKCCRYSKWTEIL